MTPVRIRYGNGVTLSATGKTSKNRGYTRKLRVNRIPDSIGMIAVNECLDYFRKALADPAGAPAWDDWWALNRDLVERTFSMVDYVRLKHRGLLGAEQILRKLGEDPKPVG